MSLFSDMICICNIVFEKMQSIKNTIQHITIQLHYSILFSFSGHQEGRDLQSSGGVGEQAACGRGPLDEKVRKREKGN